MTDRRESAGVRRPEDKHDLMKILTGNLPNTKNDAPFNYMYDVLVFAASLGFKLGKRAPIEKYSPEPIPFTTMQSNEFFETLMSTIAVLTFEGDHTCLSDDRLAERIRLFEEFANGGLLHIAEMLKGYAGTPREFVESLVSNDISNL